MNLLNHDDQPIIAQCTPRGSGAIALLRLSGTGALEVASKVSKLADGQLLQEKSTHTIHYGWVVDADKKPIDQVLFMLMRGPKTFTGQDTVEITCHNNQFIIDAIIEQILAHGARLADHGEFTRRAVNAGKLDLIQAEAINDLINANTQLGLKKSLAQLQGSFSEHIELLEQELIKALALSEASFEFIDEEMEFGPQIAQIIDNLINSIAQLKKSFDQNQQLRQGIRIALIGSVNAGKSSLFNALLGKARAIVTPIAGTTRDSIEAGISKQDSYWTLVDTAGLRHTDDVVEQEGIKRSFEQAHMADIILLVYDASRMLTAQEDAVYTKLYEQYAHKIITVFNKSDCASQNVIIPEHALLASNTNQNSIIHIEQTIATKAANLFAHLDSPFLLNQRHYKLLLALEKQLQEIRITLNSPIAYEILSIHLNDAIVQISELTGKTISEAGMDKIFREFCIGK